MDTIGSSPADFIRGGISMTFDLEAARAGIAHYRIENPSNVDTESALKELVDQANLAEDAIAEIERLRAENEDLSKAVIDIQEERDLAQAEFRSYHRAWEEQAARVQELEEVLVEMVATNPCNIPTLCDVVHDELMCPALDGNCDFWKGCPQKNELREAARKQLQAEGKIGPDAKSVNKGNQCQYCKKCGRDMRFEFSIRDEIWNKLPKTWKDRVLCIECFLEELNEVEPDQEIHFDDFNYMCILDPIEDTEWKGDRPKLLHPLFGGTLIDAKNPLAWQITEERKAAIWHAVAVLKENDPDDEHLWDEEIAVLRAMLTEAE